MAISCEKARFPVIFSDGIQEFDLGNIEISRVINFAIFQSILSQRIGILAHQMSIFFVFRKNSKIESENWDRISISDKTNFSAIFETKDSYFLVSLKRSRRQRRRKPRQSLEEIEEFSHSPIDFSQNRIVPLLLRRNMENTTAMPIFTSGGFAPPSPPPPTQAKPYFPQIDYDAKIQNLQIQREKYLMSTNLNASPNFRPNEISRVAGKVKNSRNPQDGVVLKCKGCSEKGETASFHCCVLDPVVVGFRSKFGPVARPGKVQLRLDLLGS